MKRLYYFAYGRNMLLSAIESRVGSVEKIGTMTLEGYRLLFNTGTFWAYANISEGDETDKVEGVLYELTDEQIHTLDRFEGYPYNYQKKYFTDADGNVIFAYVSTKRFFHTYFLPSRDYVMDLYNGAKENSLEATREFLKGYLANVLKRPLVKPKKKRIGL